MSGNLVDTNVIIKIINGDDKAIQYFDTLENVYISVITVGELLYGANKSSKKDYNIKLFNDFTSEYPILEVDENTSRIYGEIKSNLIKKGINIPENDIWIASIAIESDLELITFDKHFSEVPNLKVVIL